MKGLFLRKADELELHIQEKANSLSYFILELSVIIYFIIEINSEGDYLGILMLIVSFNYVINFLLQVYYRRKYISSKDDVQIPSYPKLVLKALGISFLILYLLIMVFANL